LKETRESEAVQVASVPMEAKKPKARAGQSKVVMTRASFFALKSSSVGPVST